jgi:predicted SAM-dependent methyltransferase
MNNAKCFFDTYARDIRNVAGGGGVKAIVHGSRDVNGTLRSVCPIDYNYIGVDFVAGKNVDVVLDNPYSLPFGDASVDVVLSSSVFEHSEMFWMVFFEIMRIFKPHGLLYLNAPSNGSFHRYPVDCWRFYPDSGHAMITWAKYNSINAGLLESYISHQLDDEWNDFVAVFIKNKHCANNFPHRIIDNKIDYDNGYRDDDLVIKKFSIFCEDMQIIAMSKNKIIKNTLESLVLSAQSAATDNKKIIIWGSGQGGIRVFELLEHYGVQVYALCDNSPDKIDRCIRRLPVLSPENIIANSGSSIYFIASTAYSHIAQQLETAGFHHGTGYHIVPQDILDHNFFPEIIADGRK